MHFFVTELFKQKQILDAIISATGQVGQVSLQDTVLVYYLSTNNLPGHHIYFVTIQLE